MAAHMSMPLRLHDGTRVYLRPLRTTDRDLYVTEVEKMSSRSRYERFLSAIDHVTEDMVTQLVDDVDGVDHVAIVLLTEDDDRPVALGRFIRDRRHPDRAEVAFAVADDWHGQGAGSIVTDGLKSLALARGIRYVTATVLRRNLGSLRLLARFGATESVEEVETGVVEVLVDLYGEPYGDSRPTEGRTTDGGGATDGHATDGHTKDGHATDGHATDEEERQRPDADATQELRISRGRLLGWFSTPRAQRRGQTRDSRPAPGTTSE